MLRATDIDQVVGRFQDCVAENSEKNAELLKPFFESETWQLFVADFRKQFKESKELQSDEQGTLALFGAQCFLTGTLTW